LFTHDAFGFALQRDRAADAPAAIRSRSFTHASPSASLSTSSSNVTRPSRGHRRQLE
jgi:hypothetical protein